MKDQRNIKSLRHNISGFY